MGAGNNFTIWDRFLFASGLNMMTGSDEQNTWSANPDVITNQATQSCGNNQTCVDLEWADEQFSSNISFDTDPLTTGLDYPVPGGLLNGNYLLGVYLNSLSHLGEGENEALDASLYLMAPTRPLETVFRTFTTTENELLCTLGYDVAGCNGCFNVANPDFNINIYGDRDVVCNPVNLFACAGTEITITPSDLLGNDYSNGSDLVITFLNAPFQNSVSISGPDAAGNYTVNSDFPGTFSLDYVVNACDDYQIPHTSIVDVVFGYCPSCDNDPCDNLLCVDDFEDAGNNANSAFISNYPHFFSAYSFNNTPGLYYSSVEDNHFLYLAGSGSGFLESWVLELTEPIPPGCTLDLSFIAQEQNANGSSIVVWGSEHPPCLPEDAFIALDCNAITNCDGYDYAPVCLAEIDISSIPAGDGSGMQPVTGTFVNTGNAAINFLLIYPEPGAVFFDDFVATRSCTAAFTFSTDCLDASFIANPAPEGYSIHWDFGDETMATQAMTSHTYEAAGTYNVILTLTDESCPENQEVFTQNVIVDLEACENPPLACQCTDLVLNENSGMDLSISSLVSNGDLPPNQLDLSNGQCLTINGDLLIDQDYDIIGGEIFMEAGASIIVDEFRRLRLSQINEGDGIHGCSMMWEGIKLRKGCSLSINKCIIQDAHLAVDIAADINQFRVVNTSFENNFIGIYSGPQTVHIVDFQWFYGNTLQYTANEEYLPAYPGQLNDPGTKSYAGIALSNVSSHIRLGLSSLYNFPANNFDNLRNGILTDDLSLHITNTNFSNIIRLPGDTDSGYAVKHEGGAGHDISVVGVDAPGNSSVNFTDCTVGVDITGTNTIIISSDFAEVGNGINVRQAHLRKIDINANTIQAHSRGIRLDNNDPGLGADVFNNNITIGILPNEFGVALPGVGIEVNETGLPAYELATNSITNNTIATVNGDIAIKLQDVEEYLVNGNTLSLQGNGAKGITAYSMISGNLVDNTITGQSQWVQVGGTLEEHTPQEAGIHGIDLELSPGVTLECNNVSNLETGVYFYGECLGSDMVGTRFTPPFTKGLHYAEQLSIATQPHHGNIWESGSYGTNGEGAAAVNDVPVAGFNITLQNQLYEIHTNTNGYRPPSFAFPMLPFFQQGDAANLWFIQGSGEPLDCSQFDADGFTDNDEKNLARSAIDGELVRGEYTSTRSWISRWQVYQQYSDEVVTDQQINQFLMNEASEDLGQLHAREQGRKGMHLGDPAILNQLHDNEEMLQILITELADLDQRGAQGEVVQQERLDVQLEIKEIIENLMVLESDRITSRNQEGQVYVNASPTFSVSPAEQLAQVQAIYGKTLGQGNLQLNSTDANDLLSIGDNCPLLGGVAVYKARSLYQLLVDPLYSFTNNCVPAQALQSLPVVTENASEVDRQLESVSESPQGALLAWPNPADNLLNIRLGTEVQQLLISDGFGRVYFRSSNREQKPLNISTEKWPNGLYLVTVFDEQGQLIGSQKTIIIH